MQERRETLRLCVACRLKKDRQEMYRFIQLQDSKDLVFMPSRFQFGRSMYLCKALECINKIKSIKRYRQIYEMILNIEGVYDS